MSAATRVLIVDDDLATRVRLRDVLEREPQLEVNEAVDGHAALESIGRQVPDVILLDLMMPGMTGIEVCTTLRRGAATREIPVLVLSAADEAEAMLAALDAGADDFLRKPFWAPELRAKVRNISRLNRFRALTSERDRLRWLLDHSREPLLVVGADGRIIYANDGAEELLGLAESGVQDVTLAIARHLRSDPPDALRRWRDSGMPQTSLTLFRPDTDHAAARWYELDVQGNGASGERILKFTNRSAWVRRGLEVYTFQHLIAHKIRTPLNGLAPVFAFVATTQASSVDEDMKELLRLARESADRLQDTLCGILRFHAALFAPASGSAPHREPLRDIVARAAASSGLTDSLDMAPTAASCLHPEMAEVVLTELFDNYAKFSRAKREHLAITVVTHADGTSTITLVAAGPALAPDVIAGLGRPFWQPERDFTGEVPGIGLGLATARQLLQCRGADLQLRHNEAIGGLESRIELPGGFLT